MISPLLQKPFSNERLFVYLVGGKSFLNLEDNTRKDE